MNKVDRTKRTRNALCFYKNSFQLRPPYLVLCDGNFIFAATDLKIDLEEQFTEIFQGQIYLKVSNCALDELDKMDGREFKDAKIYAHRKMQKFHCTHQTKSPKQCILDALRHGFTGAICTQDKSLRRIVHRDYPKNPVFFIARTIQIVPPPQGLKDKVTKELKEKYAAKHVEAPEIPNPNEEVSDEGDYNNENEEENINEIDNNIEANEKSQGGEEN